MHVNVSVFGVLVVDDELDLGDVEAAREHVCGDEQVDALLELADDGGPLVLHLVSVYHELGQVGAELVEYFLQVVAGLDVVDEEQDFAALQHVRQVVDHPLHLVFQLLEHHELLLYVFVRLVLLAHYDLHGVGQELLAQVSHFLVEGRAEQQHLLVRPDLP